MDAPSDGDSPWLTREQIDRAIAAMSAADLIKAIGEGSTGPKMAGDAFDIAAARLGLSNGSPATEHVGLADFAYLAEQLGKVVNVDNPLSRGQKG